MFEKLFDFVTSDKAENAKLPVILMISGFLLLYFSDKIPDSVIERGILQIVSTVIVSIGFVLLVFHVIDRMFNVNLLSSVADGVLSGLAATLIVSIVFFAPTKVFDEENYFLYRVVITLSYGMIYVGLVGVFTAFFQRNSRIDVRKNGPILIVIFIVIAYAMSKYVFMTIPIVPLEPINLGTIFTMCAIFVIINVIIHFKTFKFRRIKIFSITFGSSTALMALFLLLTRQEIIYAEDIYHSGDAIWGMVFYEDYLPSAYFFSMMMVVFTVYAAANLVVALRTLRPGSTGELNNAGSDLADVDSTKQ